MLAEISSDGTNDQCWININEITYEIDANQDRSTMASMGCQRLTNSPSEYIGKRPA